MTGEILTEPQPILIVSNRAYDSKGAIVILRGKITKLKRIVSLNRWNITKTQELEYQELKLKELTNGCK